jgi:nucleoside-diphosphate-sugar epimerase
MISINDLAKMIIKISGKNLSIHNIDGPVGVRGRNSDNKLLKEKIGWEPTNKLQNGIEKTYNWINEQVKRTSLSYADLDMLDKYSG